MNRRPESLEVRAAETSFALRWAEERRLCGIIESERSSMEEKYQALLELAYLSGVLVNGLADAA